MLSNEESLEQEASVIMRHRERRIAIKLHKKSSSSSRGGTLRRQTSSTSAKATAAALQPEFLEHKSAPPVFESGDEVSGIVHLEVNGGHPVAKIRLAVVCLSQVRWQSHTPKQRRSVISLITGDDGGNNGKINQIYFDRKVIREVDLAKASDLTKWPNGKYEFPFRLTLPEDGLASTMNSCHGFIKYTVEVFTVDEDLNESRGEKEIIIVAPILEKLDLHGRSLEKSMHILGSGKITITASLERKEYIPGEVVPVEVLIVNDANVPVEPRVTLYQQQLFACNQVHRTLESCLTSEPYSTTEAVPPNSSATALIKVPLATNLVVSLRSPLITVKYFVRVCLDLPHAMDLVVNVPFIVTTRRARAASAAVNNGAVTVVQHPQPQQHHPNHPTSPHHHHQQPQPHPLNRPIETVGIVPPPAPYHSVSCQQQQQQPPTAPARNNRINNL